MCLFRALALHLHGNQLLEEETSKIFNLFINKMERLRTNQFKGVHINNIPSGEDLVIFTILLYYIDIVEGNIMETLSENSLDEVCRDTTILSVSSDARMIYVR